MKTTDIRVYISCEDEFIWKLNQNMLLVDTLHQMHGDQ